MINSSLPGYIVSASITFALSVILTTGHVMAADDWSTLISPYIWFAGMEGDLSVVPGVSAARIDVSPTDALNGTEASFMLMFEARKRRHGVLLDIFYSDVLQENSSTGSGGPEWKASVKDTLVTVGYTYEAYSADNQVVDVIAGFRYWEVDTRFSTRAGHGAPGSTTVHNSKSWLDPAVGVKAKYRLGQSRFYIACFMGGGAGGGSDSFYDLTANIGYQISDSIVTSIGYRVFDVDYVKDSFVYDVKQEGWLMGLVWILGGNRLDP